MEVELSLLNILELHEEKQLNLNSPLSYKIYEQMGDTRTNQPTFKVNYVNASTWRKVFLLTDNQVFHAKTKYIYDRHSVISNVFIGSKVHIYSGCRFHIRYINR